MTQAQLTAKQRLVAVLQGSPFALELSKGCCSYSSRAQVVELVDTPDSGSGGGNTVEVRVLSWAHPDLARRKLAAEVWFAIQSRRGGRNHLSAISRRRGSISASPLIPGSMASGVAQKPRDLMPSSSSRSVSASGEKRTHPSPLPAPEIFAAAP